MPESDVWYSPRAQLIQQIAEMCESALRERRERPVTHQSLSEYLEVINPSLWKTGELRMPVRSFHQYLESINFRGSTSGTEFHCRGVPIVVDVTVTEPFVFDARR